MKLKLKAKHAIGIIIGLTMILLDFVLFFPDSRLFKPILAISVIIATLQFWIDLIKENKRQKEVEAKFLEFVRSLVETVRSGIPIPKAIIQISNADFGALTPHVKKLANQIEWGIPLRRSLTTFSQDTNNRVIRRSMSIVIEAEESGGNIEDVLQAVTNSVLQIKKIKDERRSNSYSQMVQGYFVFFIFIVIMLVLQVFLIPQLGSITGAVLSGLGGFEGIVENAPTSATEAALQSLNLKAIFTGLVLIQGLFAGLMIGKFSEGEIKQGLKHSLILMAVGYLLIATFG